MVRITMEDGGIIDIELNEEVAPITCENFKKDVYKRQDLYRCAGAGHLRLYRPFRDPVS